MMMNYRSKYGNKKVKIGGITFDSKKESSRYLELILLQKAGMIKDLEVHPKYVLIPKQGKEREVTYSADFRYYDNVKKELIVEDVKGEATRKDKTYIIKRKLMKYIHGITITET